MGLLDTLFGEGPSTSVQELFSIEDVLSTFGQFRGQMGGLLEMLTKGAFGASSAFGPAFQGGVGRSVAQAQQSGLLPLLQLAAQTEAGRHQFVTDPGSAGLIPSLLSGAAGGFGAGLGARLFGGGGGGLGGGGLGGGVGFPNVTGSVGFPPSARANRFTF